MLNASFSRAFAQDALDRLSSDQGASGTRTYQYDSVGNRTGRWLDGTPEQSITVVRIGMMVPEFGILVFDILSDEDKREHNSAGIPGSVLSHLPAAARRGCGTGARSFRCSAFAE